MELQPKEILKEITNYLDIITIIKLRKVNKYLYNNIPITDLLNIKNNPAY